MLICIFLVFSLLINRLGGENSGGRGNRAIRPCPLLIAADGFRLAGQAGGDADGGCVVQQQERQQDQAGAAKPEVPATFSSWLRAHQARPCLFLSGRWVSANPAATIAALLDWGLWITLEAAAAARLLMASRSLLGIMPVTSHALCRSGLRVQCSASPVSVNRQFRGGGLF